MRKIEFEVGEYYHIFNRGVDKREIFSDKYDAYRFIQSLKEFNSVGIGNDIFYVNKNKGIYKSKEDLRKVGCLAPHFSSGNKSERLVNIVCYCLILNHYHFILEQLVEDGISKFMHRIGGYTKYYNDKYDRNGSLFQGTFKAVHIRTDERLQELSAYVNLNNKVHKKFESGEKNFLDLIPNRSSWKEYTGESKYKFCKKDTVLSQFKSKKKYKNFAECYVKIVKEDRCEDES